MYETLAREAENECIEVIEISFKGKIKGLYYNRVIAINKHIETTAEKPVFWPKNSAIITQVLAIS